MKVTAAAGFLADYSGRAGEAYSGSPEWRPTHLQFGRTAHIDGRRGSGWRGDDFF